MPKVLTLKPQNTKLLLFFTIIFFYRIFLRQLEEKTKKLMLVCLPPHEISSACPYFASKTYSNPLFHPLVCNFSSFFMLSAPTLTDCMSDCHVMAFFFIPPLTLCRALAPDAGLNPQNICKPPPCSPGEWCSPPHVYVCELWPTNFTLGLIRTHSCFKALVICWHSFQHTLCFFC